MFDLLSLTIPIFLLIALGFGAARSGVVQAEFVRGLGFFVLNFALPALVLHALLEQDLRQTFNWSYLLVYAGGSLAVFLVSLLILRVWSRRDLTEASLASFGTVAANSGFIGFPVASLSIGAPALTALPLTMLVENVLVIPLALALAEIGQQRGQALRAIVGQSALRLARTPLVVAILLGLVLSATGIHPPETISRAIDMVADASAACALFVVGGTLAGLKAASFAGDLFWIVLGKLVLHPLAVGVGFALVGGVSPGLAAAGVVLAAAPMMTIYPILGQRFGHEGLCSAALVVATALGFLTMTAVIAMVDPGIAVSSAEGPS